MTTIEKKIQEKFEEIQKWLEEEMLFRPYDQSQTGASRASKLGRPGNI